MLLHHNRRFSTLPREKAAFLNRNASSGILRSTWPRRCVSVAAINTNSHSSSISGRDLKFLKQASLVAKKSEGLFQPHPYSGCVVVHSDGNVLVETHQRAQGTVSAECQAAASIDALGCTAYLNLEPGDVEGGVLSVKALAEAGVQRVVIGMLHPMPHLRHGAVKALKERGIDVAVLGIAPCHASEAEIQEVEMECLQTNEALLHRVVTHKPLSLLKYAMTLDGKIAASTGHAGWVSSPIARQRVFATRAISDAVIVGGNTVRTDNPNLTTRREEGFSPTRIVMSRTMDLPSDANLWNLDKAPTIVMTQRGARPSFQAELRDKGIDVVEFDFLSPSHVADYCYERGFMQVLWECGGTLAAPAIASGAIHKVMAFVSPKIIGGCRAPNPCGELGFVEMTQAVQISHMDIQKVGPDVMLTGYLPSSGGLLSLADAVDQISTQHESVTTHKPSFLRTQMPTSTNSQNAIIKFFKSWDEWGVFSNFSVYPIVTYSGVGPHGKLPSSLDEDSELWPSVEHYYQAQKFAGVDDPLARRIRQQIKESTSPEEAAKIGRRMTREQPSLLRQDWTEKRVEVMFEANLAKFQSHEGARNMLLSTADSIIIEDSPHDAFWGCGIDGQGENHLGKILMSVRQKLQQQQQQQQQQLKSEGEIHAPSGTRVFGS